MEPRSDLAVDIAQAGETSLRSDQRGTRSGLQESVPIPFPLGIVAAFAVCRTTARGDREPLGVKALVLLAAPPPSAP